MRWMTILFYNVILNAVSGTLIFGVWSICKRIWEKKGQYDVLYNCLKVVLAAFLLPIGWLYLFFISYDWTDGSWWNAFPWISAGMERIGLFLFLLWLPGMLIRFGLYWKEKCLIHRMKRMAVPVRAGKEWEQLQKLARQSGIQKVPALYRIKMIGSPMAGGFFRKSIFLPDKEYSPEKWSLIMVHELNHIRQGDLFLKNMAALAEVLFWFYPLAYRLFREMDSWGEINCDLRTCTFSGACWDTKTYYELIMDEALEIQKERHHFSSALYESEATLKWRIMKMLNYRKTKNLKKSSGLVLALLFVLTCPLVAFASGGQMGMVYEEMMESTVTSTVDTSVQVVLQEEYEGPSLDKPDELVPIDPTRSLGSVNWTIEPGKKKMTSAISLNEGAQIHLWAKTSPSDAKIRMGICSSDGSRRYVTFSGQGAHDFNITQSDAYNIFVENISGGDVSVELGYGY